MGMTTQLTDIDIFSVKLKSLAGLVEVLVFRQKICYFLAGFKYCSIRGRDILIVESFF